MANRKRPLQRTISFWRFVQAPDMTPLGQVDWVPVLAEVAQRARRGQSRHSIYGNDVTGSVYTCDGIDHLVLTKNRDDMPRQQNRRTGVVEDMITNDDGWTVVESAFLKFLDFGNVFGVLQSQVTAPSPQAIANWLNATQILDVPLAAEAVIDPARWEHLREAGGVTMLEFAAPSVVLDREVSGPLDYLLSPARFGNLKVAVKVQAKRARNAEAARQRRDLYEATEALATQIGVENLDMAKVKIFDEDQKGISPETINLLKQRFTTKRNVQLTSGVRSSVSELSAFNAILSAVHKLEDDLRAAVHEDPLDT